MNDKMIDSIVKMLKFLFYDYRYLQNFHVCSDITRKMHGFTLTKNKERKTSYFTSEKMLWKEHWKQVYIV